MTFVRGLAVDISQRVVRWAAPGCREWAEGLAREVEFIESDWRALAWAIGSTRLIFDRREAPIGSLAEVPRAARTLVETLRDGDGKLWIAMCQAPLFLIRYSDARTTLGRSGCGLVVCGAAVAAIYLLTERRRLKEPWKDDIYDNIGACTLFYRAELERRRYKVWIPSFLMLCYCIGLMLAQRGGILSGEPLLTVTAALGCLLAGPAFLYARRTNELRIERLDALLAEQR
jgi:hypothetical protein